MPTPGTVYRDENGDLIWKGPCGSDNPLCLPSGRYIDKCPVCQKASAPSREMRSPLAGERALVNGENEENRRASDTIGFRQPKISTRFRLSLLSA
jgi:hypothetical protein